MNHKAVREELAARLNTIAGLTATADPVTQVAPPQAVVVLYPVTYDLTYGRGRDTLNAQVLLFVGQPNDAHTADRLDEYLSGSGTRSTKQVLESHTGWTTFNTVRQVDADVDVIRVGGKDLLTAVINLQISGKGAA